MTFWETYGVSIIITALIFYVVGVVALLLSATDYHYPRDRARYRLAAPVWPLVLVVLALKGINPGGRAIGRTFRDAFRPAEPERITYGGKR